MQQIGGVIEQMEALTSTFRSKAAQVAELTREIDGQLANTWWVGPAAERFRSSWSGEYKPALARLQASLEEAAAEVERRKNALVQSGS